MRQINTGLNTREMILEMIDEADAPRLLSSGTGIAGESLFYVIVSALLSTTASSVLPLSSR
ncbi:hypothetical protein N6N71_04260 [Escherichia albertii]|nr:hypothetical protein [Escherichia albertii]MCU7307858.1 hypothetical protein [Escherichia albertii]MCU7312689.1 hypothetical protein [Escherichia albertii]MCU7316853.1 hypothetical protein [Escherichia albertii]MCZ8674121.1 hypothetical protein [Escherichia albertii]WDB73617.1 hypothetical protein PS034_19475 [Escherichia albertii]